MLEQKPINLDAERLEHSRRRRMDEALVDYLCNQILELQNRLAAVEARLISQDYPERKKGK